MRYTAYSMLPVPSNRPLATNSDRRVEPPITLGPCIETHRQTHILIIPVRRLVCFGGLLESLRLLHEPSVMHEDGLVVICLKRCAYIRPPKAILRNAHPVTARRREAGLDPWAVDLGFANNPIVALAIGRTFRRLQGADRFRGRETPRSIPLAKLVCQVGMTTGGRCRTSESRYHRNDLQKVPCLPPP